MDILNTISNNRFWNKHGQRIALTTSILCFSAVLGSVAWSIQSNINLKAQGYQAQGNVPITPQQRKSYQVSNIVAANLFGDPAPVIEKDNAPTTTLNITLEGILWASEAKNARVIIKSGNRNSELYSNGESIKGAGARVKEIRSSEVLLDRNGATESLPLIKSNKSGDRAIITFSEAPNNKTPRANNKFRSRAPASNPQPPLQGKLRDKLQGKLGERMAKRRSENPDRPRRNFRERDFSGADRALKKVGEI